MILYVAGNMRGVAFYNAPAFAAAKSHLSNLGVEAVTPVELDRWPSADTDSRLVFITRNIESEVIRNLFAAVGAITSAS